MRNAINGLFDVTLCVVLVSSVLVMLYAANNAEFSNYLTGVIDAIYDYFL